MSGEIDDLGTGSSANLAYLRCLPADCGEFKPVEMVA